MALDHSFAAFDPHHFVTDSAAIWRPGSPIPAFPFLVRWVTHFCAPVFVFLAGASLVLARARHGEHALRRAAERGAFLALLDPLVLCWLWHVIEPFEETFLFQVIFAIGVSMLCCVAALRWIPSAWRTAFAAAYLVAQDAIVWTALGGLEDARPSGVVAFALTGGFGGSWLVIYPILPWCAVMLLGVRLGEELRDAGSDTRRVERRCVGTGLALIALFALVRAMNGYGNLGLFRDDASPLQWLHVSKYPPALSFVAMTLGPALIALGALLARERRSRELPRMLEPIAVLGRAALVFYGTHLAVLVALRSALPASWHGAPLAVVVAIALPLALLPLARVYLAARRAHPDGWLRWL